MGNNSFENIRKLKKKKTRVRFYGYNDDYDRQSGTFEDVNLQDASPSLNRYNTTISSRRKTNYSRNVGGLLYDTIFSI